MDLFDPIGDGEWTRVDPALTKLRRITAVLPLLVSALIPAVVATLIPDLKWIPGIVAVGLLAGAVWVWFWADRNRRSWGYAEQQEELLITSGVWFRRLVAIPYGRMQFVDVQAGPIQQWLGLASVTLHTASTETAATVPGVPTEEAARLRNRLTELGESRGAGV